MVQRHPIVAPPFLGGHEVERRRPKGNGPEQVDHTDHREPESEHELEGRMPRRTGCGGTDHAEGVDPDAGLFLLADSVTKLLWLPEVEAHTFAEVAQVAGEYGVLCASTQRARTSEPTLGSAGGEGWRVP